MSRYKAVGDRNAQYYFSDVGRNSNAAYKLFGDGVRSRGAVADTKTGDLVDYATVEKRFPLGTANYYDDSWKTILNSLEQYGVSPGQPGVGGMYGDIIRNFQGKPGDLVEFLNQSAPFIAASLQGTDAFKRTQGQQFFDPMQGYGAVSARNNAAANQARVQGMRQLGQSGLGRSAGRATIARMGAAQTGAANASAFTNLYQARQQQMMDQNQRALDAHRMVATMALGMNPQPRAPQEKGNPWASVGGAVGGILGTAIAPGAGTAAGAAIGSQVGG